MKAKGKEKCIPKVVKQRVIMSPRKNFLSLETIYEFY